MLWALGAPRDRKSGFFRLFLFFLLTIMGFLLFTVNFNVVNVKKVLASKILKYYGPQGPLGTLKDVFFSQKRVFFSILIFFLNIANFYPLSEE